jgi:hypothetical protein
MNTFASHQIQNKVIVGLAEMVQSEMSKVKES